MVKHTLKYKILQKISCFLGNLLNKDKFHDWALYFDCLDKFECNADRDCLDCEHTNWSVCRCCGKRKWIGDRNDI